MGYLVIFTFSVPVSVTYFNNHYDLVVHYTAYYILTYIGVFTGFAEHAVA
jgi:hypothetical protein